MALATKMTRRLLLRILIIAALAGPLIAFVNSILWLRSGVKYQPPITEAESKRLSGLPLADVEALLKAREVRMTRTQVLAESVEYSYFWKNLAENSLVPSLGVFLACVCLGFLEKRSGHRMNSGSTSSLTDAQHVGTVVSVSELKDKQTRMVTLCVVLAFVPCIISAIYIQADIAFSSLLNPVDLSALLWLGMTCLHFWRTRTRSAALLFALFPIAFVEPALLVFLKFSATVPGK